MNNLATRRPRRLYVAVFAVAAIIVLILDQGSKAWAKQALADGRTVEVIPRLLNFVLVHNPGASLGFASGHTWIIALAAIVVCILLAIASAVTDSVEWAVMLGITFGGAAGNAIDRIVYADGFLNGKVVDFIDYGWSVGNVADIFLCVAGVYAVVLVLRDVPFRHASDIADENAGQNAQDHDRGVNSRGSEVR